MLKAHAVFYPGRLEAPGTVVSIGGPKGTALVAAGFAEPAAQPPEQETEPSQKTMIAEPQSNAPGSAYTKPNFARSTESLSSADALIAALGRRARRRRRNA
jgi:hypothetical protein